MHGGLGTTGKQSGAVEMDKNAEKNCHI